MERRGPHKSMHCKFCKPPGTIVPEGPSPAQLETKTKLHLSHQSADLKVFDVFDEPGVVAEESETCICQVEGYQPCPKCAPDKSRRPVKKKVCDCPLGSKPHPNMAGLDIANQKKKKKKDDDDEFWWEKYDREHDAIVKDTWAAYLAQRKEEKKLAKCRDKSGAQLSSMTSNSWYQKLSCQQVNYLEYLSTAIRLDLDENITDRTFFVLGGIGLYPRPKKKVLQKCLRYCHYNTIRFLNQLSMLIQEEDPFKEKVKKPGVPMEKQIYYSWNDRILMGCMCHLEFPKLLREIIDRLPPLPQEKLLPQIPKPKFRRPSIKEYESPYDEPLWRERLNWVEKEKLERINRARQHMDTKRVKIPALALVRRPSLIDARPAFLSHIEASLSFNRRRSAMKKKFKTVRKKEKLTFDSKVDITAIARIAASEVSTTPKADSEEICVFLRDETKSVTEELEEKEEVEDEEEEEEEHNFEQRGETREEEETLVTFAKVGATNKSSSFSAGDDVLLPEDLDMEDDIPFVTPPKTGSGATIQSPCQPPKGSPGPPASHYDLAIRELGLINQDLCVFNPNKEKSDGEPEKKDEGNMPIVNVEEQLMQVAEKLKSLNLEIEEEAEEAGGEGKTEDKPIKQVGVISNMEPKKRGSKKKKKAVITEEEEPQTEYEPIMGFTMPPGHLLFGDFPETGVEEEEEQEPDKVDSQSTEVCVCEPYEDKKISDENIYKGSISKKRKKKKKGKNEKKQTVNTPVKPPMKNKYNPCRNRMNNNETGIKLNTPKIQKQVVIQVEPKGTDDSDISDDDDEVSESPEKLSLEEEDKTFYGDVVPLLKTILKDLKDEGFISAGYPAIEEHPDIKQLIKYLQGEIVTQKTKKRLHIKSRSLWKAISKRKKEKLNPPELNISQKKYDTATWNDKNWIFKLAQRKKEEFFFNIAKLRSNESKEFYLTLFQEYFGTDRFLKSYYAYMIPMKQECILRGFY